MDGLADIHKQLAEMQRALGRIEGAVHGVPARVGKLEAWRNYMAGAIAVLIAGLGLVVRSH
jgi:hypothetical protein